MTAPGRMSCERIVAEWKASHFVYDCAWPKKVCLNVALLAWRRPAYLRKTLASFFEHTDRARLRLWCGTDGGYDPEVLRIAEGGGFVVVSVPRRHLGIARAWTALIEAVAERAGPDELVLNLEEDWELRRPLPMGLIYALLRGQGAEAVRIWKAKFSTAGAVQKLALAAGGVEPIWVGLGWAAHPPCIETVAFAQWLNVGIKDERFMLKRCREAQTRVAWFDAARAPFRHIGVTRSRRLGGKT